MGPNAKAWMAGLAFLAIVGIQAALVELPLSPAESGWSKVLLAVLMAGGTFGVWRVPNTPAPPVTARRWPGDEAKGQ